MKKLFFILILIQSQLLLANENMTKLKEIKTLNSFAFGSCNREYMDQPLWPKIMADKPQLYVWGGDNIYGDRGPNKDNLFLKYIIQNNIKEYQNIKTQMPIIGIWDDHDYGSNNGTGEFARKYLSQQLFLDFIEEPVDSNRRNQEGIYTSYTFGEGNKTVKFYLLDNRFHLTDKNEKNYTVLGNQQWEWLEEEFKNSKATINIIVSGLPFLPEKMIHTEEWADYPAEKAKMLNLIEQYQLSGVLFLSGDKHFAAITKNYGYYEFMSSGLTHVTNPILVPWIKTIFPTSYFKLNYALFNIAWERSPIELNIKIKGVEGTAIDQTYQLIDKKFR